MVGSNWCRLVRELADKHNIKDNGRLLETVEWAAIAYDGLEHPIDDGGKDTLDKVEKLAEKLLQLLLIEVNQHRIIDALIDQRYPNRECAADPIGEITDKFEEM